jgi:hypothetical protein
VQYYCSECVRPCTDESDDVKDSSYEELGCTYVISFLGTI